MASVNSDIMIRSVLLLAIIVSFIFYFSPVFGEVPLAANQILMQFLTLTAYALDGLAFAVESLVGQAMGGRDPARLRRAAWMCAMWGALVSVVLALIFALAGGLIIDLMTTSPELRAEARRYLPWMIATPVVGVAAWMLDGIFIGATRARDMRNMMVIAVGFYFVAAGVMIWGFGWGNHGLWAALTLSYLARACALGVRYPALERAAARAI